jgi:hypothetical protein
MRLRRTPPKVSDCPLTPPEFHFVDDGGGEEREAQHQRLQI